MASSVSKFGLEYNKVSDYDNNLYNGNGSYSYDWTYNFIADYLNLTTGIGGAAYTYPGGATSCPGGTGTVYCQTYYSFGQSYGNAPRRSLHASTPAMRPTTGAFCPI
jgi:hypothetical protein